MSAALCALRATDWAGLAGTLAAAGLGAAASGAVGFPVPALTGSALGVAVAATAGLRCAMPGWLRSVAFILLGINIGAGVTPETLATAMAWPASIAIMAVSMLGGMAVAQAGLRRWLGFGRDDAMLAAAPGHLSYVLAISTERGGATDRIALVQSTRVLVLTLGVPVLITLGMGIDTPPQDPPRIMAPWHAAGLVLATVIVGRLLSRLRLPAALLLAGMGLSAGGHALDLTPGGLPGWATIAAFLVMGSLIGSRFVGQGPRALLGALPAGLWVTGVAVVAAVAGLACAALVLDLTAPLLIVAYAPGGVEAMAAIALQTGLDPAFVAAHHTVRLMILSLLMAVLLRPRH